MKLLYDAHGIRTHVRWLIRRDLPEVNEIEASVGAWEVSEEEIIHAINQRNCIGMIAEQGERVVGWMQYELCKDYLYLLHLRVHPDYRRRGIGTVMLNALLDKLSPHRRTHLVIIVRESDLEDQLFYRSQGLWAVQVIPSDHVENEDRYLMEYRLAVQQEPEEPCPAETEHEHGGEG